MNPVGCALDFGGEGMTGDEVKNAICTLFLDGDLDFPIDEDTDLLEEGICDSLGLAQLASQLEGMQAGLRILDPDITAENLGSIRKILAFVGE